jgi:hypothetical protein
VTLRGPCGHRRRRSRPRGATPRFAGPLPRERMACGPPSGRQALALLPHRRVLATPNSRRIFIQGGRIGRGSEDGRRHEVWGAGRSGRVRPLGLDAGRTVPPRRHPADRVGRDPQGRAGHGGKGSIRCHSATMRNTVSRSKEQRYISPVRSVPKETGYPAWAPAKLRSATTVPLETLMARTMPSQRSV